AVLLIGAVAHVRNRRDAAIAATAFAIIGFLVGLSFTVRGGTAIDVAYHATMLPLLLFTFLVLTRTRRQERPPYLEPSRQKRQQTRRHAEHHPDAAGGLRPGGAPWGPRDAV